MIKLTATQRQKRTADVLTLAAVKCVNSDFQVREKADVTISEISTG